MGSIAKRIKILEKSNETRGERIKIVEKK